MSEQMELTNAEKTFALRMLPHIVMGKSFEAAASAVLEDDERIFAALCERRHSHYVPTPDERGFSHTSNIGKGDVIASELSKTVYERLRAA